MSKGETEFEDGAVWFPKLKEVGVEAFSDVDFGNGFGVSEKAGVVFVDTALFADEESILFGCSSGLASNERPERSAMDTDKAAWNEFVKPGMVSKHAKQSFERPLQYADVEKCLNSSSACCTRSRCYVTFGQVLICQDQCCHKLRTLIVLSRDTLSSFSLAPSHPRESQTAKLGDCVLRLNIVHVLTFRDRLDPIRTSALERDETLHSFLL